VDGAVLGKPTYQN